MITKLKNGVLITTLILLILSIGVIIFQRSSVNNLTINNDMLQQKAILLENNIQILNDTIKYWITSDSTEVATIGILNLSESDFKSKYIDINEKFNRLKSSTNSIRETYIGSNLNIKSVTSINANKDNIIGDTSIQFQNSMFIDSLNNSNTFGRILFNIDSNKIQSVNVNIHTEQNIGLNIGIFKDSDSLERISIGTKYPNVKIKLIGINDIEQRLNEYKKNVASKDKGSSKFNISLSLGYGANLKHSYVTLSPFIGIGVAYTILRLK